MMIVVKRKVIGLLREKSSQMNSYEKRPTIAFLWGYLQYPSATSAMHGSKPVEGKVMWTAQLKEEQQLISSVSTFG